MTINRRSAGSRPWSRTGKVATALGAAAALQLAAILPAAAVFDAADDSAAQGVAVQTQVGNTTASFGVSSTSNPGHPGSEESSLNLLVNDSPVLDLGSLQLPLFRNPDTGAGLISLAQAGLFASYAESPSEISSTASAGILGEGGALAISPNSGQGTAPAYIDLIDLLDQVGVTEFTDDYISKARLEVGAFASQAVCTEGDASGEYVLGDLKFELESALLGSLSEQLPGLAGSIVGLVEDDINNLIEGLVSPLVDELTDAINGLQLTVGDYTLAGVSVDSMSVQVSGVADFVSAVVGSLTGEFSNTDGSLVINLSEGSVYLDAAEILGGLNGLAPNTEMLSTAFATLVAEALGEVVTAMAQDVTDAAISSLDQLNVEISGDLSASVVGLFNTAGSFSIEGSVADFLLQSGTAPIVDVDWVEVIPGFPPFFPDTTINIGDAATTAINGALGAVLSGFNPAIDAILGGLDDIIADGVGLAIAGALQPLDGVFDELGNYLSIRINEQPTEAPFNLDGDLGADSFTIRALTVTFLPDGIDGAAKLILGSSSVKCAEEESDDGNGDEDGGADDGNGDDDGTGDTPGGDNGTGGDNTNLDDLPTTGGEDIDRIGDLGVGVNGLLIGSVALLLTGAAALYARARRIVT